MKVAFDLRPLQIGHQYRGIGICLQNILKQVQNSPDTIKHWELVFYVYKNHELPAILDNYTVPHRIIATQEILPPHGRLKLTRYLKGMYASWRKANSINYLSEIKYMDVFVQFDFLLGVPSHSNTKSILLKYDVIPLVSEAHYLPTFKQVRARTKSIRSAIRAQRHRARYLWLLRKSLQRADLVLAISDHTKQDLVNFLNIDEHKITTLSLAADDLLSSPVEEPKDKLFSSMDWRFISGQQRYRSLSILDKPYLMYIGGVDPRRCIQDLVLAYNLLRAEGINCALILAGYDFQVLKTIPSVDARDALRHSSYSEDIYFLGFVSSEEKSLLYQNAVAFVYPTLYEGFGLPVLEAMQQGCPVVCYDNSSLREVGGTAALYAKAPEDIAIIIKSLLSDKDLRSRTISKGKEQAKKFSWQKTTSKFIKLIENLKTKDYRL